MWVLRRRVKTAESTRIFALDDDTGRCLISPAQSNIQLPQRLRFGRRFNLHHDLYIIYPGEALHASGHF